MLAERRMGEERVNNLPCIREQPCQRVANAGYRGGPHGPLTKDLSMQDEFASD